MLNCSKWYQTAPRSCLFSSQHRSGSSSTSPHIRLFSSVEVGGEFVLCLYRPHTFPQGPVIYRSPKTHLDRVQSRVGERNSSKPSCVKTRRQRIAGYCGPSTELPKDRGTLWMALKTYKVTHTQDAKAFGNLRESTQARTLLAHMSGIAPGESGYFGETLRRCSFSKTGTWSPALLKQLRSMSAPSATLLRWRDAIKRGIKHVVRHVVQRFGIASGMADTTESEAQFIGRGLV